MYKKMLVPVDGSKLAEAAFAYAKELAGRLDADVTILNVVDHKESETLPIHQAYVDHSAEIMRLGVSTVQKKLSKKQRPNPPNIIGEVTEGYAAEEILKYAREKGIDMITMSTHGRSGIRRWVLGSVADKVLRASFVPVMLVRSEAADKAEFERWKDVTLIVPLDGSEPAESVLPHVQEIAKQTGNEMLDVVLIRVCEPPEMPVAEAKFDWQRLMDENWTACKRETKEYLSGIENHLKQTGLKVRSEPIEQKKADVAAEIIEYANKIPSSLIVMATCGHSGISQWAYGSVAHKVLTGSSRPILMVRPGSTGDSARC